MIGGGAESAEEMVDARQYLDDMAADDSGFEDDDEFADNEMVDRVRVTDDEQLFVINYKSKKDYIQVL